MLFNLYSCEYFPQPFYKKIQIYRKFVGIVQWMAIYPLSRFTNLHFATFTLFFFPKICISTQYFFSVGKSFKSFSQRIQLLYYIYWIIELYYILLNYYIYWIYYIQLYYSKYLNMSSKNKEILLDSNSESITFRKSNIENIISNIWTKLKCPQLSQYL